MKRMTLLVLPFFALHLMAASHAPDARAANDSNVITTRAPASDWMSAYPDRALGELTLPASHDAGMSTPPGLQVTNCRGGAFYNITLTQSADMAGQLALGVRMFDVRPVLSDGSLYTAHGTKESIDAVGLQLNAGCRGQSIDSLFAQLRTFMDQHPDEVVIINTQNIDYHAGMFSGASGSEVADHYKSAAESYLGPLIFRPGDFPATALARDVWDMNVGDLVAQNRRVILTMECNHTDIARGFLGCLPSTPGPRDVYLANTTGPWANSPHATTVASRVVSGWRHHVNSGKTSGFGMSWTATMDTNCTAGAFSWKLFGVPPSRLPSFMKRLLTRAGIAVEGYDHCRSIETMTAPLHDLFLPTLTQLTSEGYLCPQRRPRVISLDFVDAAMASTIIRLNDASTFTNEGACLAR